MGCLKPPRGAPDVDGPRRQTLAPQLLTGTFHFEFFAAGTLIRLVNSLANRAQEIKGGGAWIWDAQGPGQQQSDSAEVDRGRGKAGANFIILPLCLLSGPCCLGAGWIFQALTFRAGPGSQPLPASYWGN